LTKSGKSIKMSLDAISTSLSLSVVLNADDILVNDIMNLASGIVSLVIGGIQYAKSWI
jgi:hypothetical protein